MKTLIIVPTYNECENIEPLLKEILAIVPLGVEVLVVDDGSPDGTGALVDSFSQQEARVHILHRTEKAGLGRAYIAGFRWAFEHGFDRVVEMDADFSHSPRYLPTMLGLLNTADVVIGSRYVHGGGTVNWGWVRKLISRGGSWYARTLLGMDVRDCTGGFNGWHRTLLERMDLDSLRSEGYAFQIELKYRASLLGARIKEFPIVFEDRKVGHSKMSRRIVFEAMLRVWQFKWSPKPTSRTNPSH